MTSPRKWPAGPRTSAGGDLRSGPAQSACARSGELRRREEADPAPSETIHGAGVLHGCGRRRCRRVGRRRRRVVAKVGCARTAEESTYKKNRTPGGSRKRVREKSRRQCAGVGFSGTAWKRRRRIRRSVVSVRGRVELSGLCARPGLPCGPGSRICVRGGAWKVGRSVSWSFLMWKKRLSQAPELPVSSREDGAFSPEGRAASRPSAYGYVDRERVRPPRTSARRGFPFPRGLYRRLRRWR